MRPLGTHTSSFCLSQCHEYRVGMLEHPALVRRPKASTSFVVMMLSFSVACLAVTIRGLLKVSCLLY